MRSINISTQVFAKIWSLHQEGEETEDQILRRVLKVPSSSHETNEGVTPSQQGVGGFVDRRYDVHFPEGFEIFRKYMGTHYAAVALSGAWRLSMDGKSYGSLNELSSAIGVRTENAWANWYFRNSDGKKTPVSELRDPSKIDRRSNPEKSDQDLSKNRTKGSKMMVGDGTTWRDDVAAALRKLEGQASLHRIYKEVEAIRKGANRSVPRSLEATVRRTLEDHSSDSHNYRGTYDIFTMPEGKGAGVWALR